MTAPPGRFLCLYEARVGIRDEQPSWIEEWSLPGCSWAVRRVERWRPTRAPRDAVEVTELEVTELVAIDPR